MVYGRVQDACERIIDGAGQIAPTVNSSRSLSRARAVRLAVIGFVSRAITRSRGAAQELQDVRDPAHHGPGCSSRSGHEGAHDGDVFGIESVPPDEADDNSDPNGKSASCAETEADPRSFHSRPL